MKKKNITFADALSRIQVSRPEASPNVNFRNQLKHFQEEYLQIPLTPRRSDPPDVIYL